MCNLCIKKIRHLNLKILTANDVEAALGKCPAMKALEDLTPSGSEFWEDPQYCFKHVRDKMKMLYDSLIRARGELNQYRKENKQ